MAARFIAEARCGSESGSVTSRSVCFCCCQVYLWTQQPGADSRAGGGGGRGCAEVSEEGAPAPASRSEVETAAGRDGSAESRATGKVTHVVRVWLCRSFVSMLRAPAQTSHIQPPSSSSSAPARGRRAATCHRCFKIRSSTTLVGNSNHDDDDATRGGLVALFGGMLMPYLPFFCWKEEPGKWSEQCL